MNGISLLGVALHQGFNDCQEMDIDEFLFLCTVAQKCLK